MTNSGVRRSGNKTVKYKVRIKSLTNYKTTTVDCIVETDPYAESADISQSPKKVRVCLGLCGYATNLNGAEDMGASCFALSEKPPLLQFLDTSSPARVVKGLMTGSIVSICGMGSAFSASTSHGVSCLGSSHSPAWGGGFPVDEGESWLRSL